MVFRVKKRANTQRDSKSPYRKRIMASNRLNLEWSKPKCYNYQMIADCKFCIKDIRCQTYREKKDHSTTLGSKRKYDAFVT